MKFKSLSYYNSFVSINIIDAHTQLGINIYDIPEAENLKKELKATIVQIDEFITSKKQNAKG